MKSKKAQGLPMNTIVIAALVLVVLVVLIMIFTGSMGNFTGQSQKICADYGGVCSANMQCEEGYLPIGKTSDCKDRSHGSQGPYCCVLSQKE